MQARSNWRFSLKVNSLNQLYEKHSIYKNSTSTAQIKQLSITQRGTDNVQINVDFCDISYAWFALLFKNACPSYQKKEMMDNAVSICVSFPTDNLSAIYSFFLALTNFEPIYPINVFLDMCNSLGLTERYINELLDSLHEKELTIEALLNILEKKQQTIKQQKEQITELKTDLSKKEETIKEKNIVMEKQAAHIKALESSQSLAPSVLHLTMNRLGLSCVARSQFLFFSKPTSTQKEETKTLVIRPQMG